MPLWRLLFPFFLPKPQNLSAIGCRRLFRFVVLKLVVYPVSDFVRQVLLRIVVPWVRVRVLVGKAPPQFFGAGIVLSLR